VLDRAPQGPYRAACLPVIINPPRRPAGRP